MNWTEASCRQTAEQTALGTDCAQLRNQPCNRAPQASNSPREDPLIPTNTALPFKMCSEMTNPPPLQGLTFPQIPGFIGCFYLLASLEASTGEPASRLISRLAEGDRSGAVPMPKEVSRGFPYTTAEEEPCGQGCWKGWPHPELLLLCSSLPKYLLEPEHASPLGSL